MHFFIETVLLNSTNLVHTLVLQRTMNQNSPGGLFYLRQLGNLKLQDVKLIERTLIDCN